jgi:hypothetical protein
MDNANLRLILRYAVAGFVVVAALAVAYPTLVRPDVSELLATCAKASALVATCCGAALGVAFVSHKVKSWRSQRPPELQPAMIEALTQAAGPTLATQQEAVTLQFEAEHFRGNDDGLERWKSAVTRFCLLGNLRGFAWLDLRGLVDRDSPGRPGWDTLVHLLAEHDPPILELGAGSRKTQWAPGWSYCRLRVELKFDVITLPFPAGAPAPMVRWVRGYDIPRMQSIQTKYSSSRALETLAYDAGADAGESETTR